MPTYEHTDEVKGFCRWYFSEMESKEGQSISNQFKDSFQ